MNSIYIYGASGHGLVVADIKILWQTFLKVVKRSDISATNSVTIEKFRGNNSEK
jgi:hypothetical protein